MAFLLSSHSLTRKTSTSLLLFLIISLRGQNSIVSQLPSLPQVFRYCTSNLVYLYCHLCPNTCSLSPLTILFPSPSPSPELNSLPSILLSFLSPTDITSATRVFRFLSRFCYTPLPLSPNISNLMIAFSTSWPRPHSFFPSYTYYLISTHLTPNIRPPTHNGYHYTPAATLSTHIVHTDTHTHL